ncbi:MAG: hypothetical protein J6C97_03360, partial [Clostridia bacterium]|nr:hypothetical protein [Clostridia bacterium]
MKRISVFFILIFLLSVMLVMGSCATQPLTSSGDSSVSSTSLQPSASQSSYVEDKFFSVTVQNLDGGSVSVDKFSAKQGEIVTLSYTASKGYEFARYIVKQGNTAIAVSNGKFTMPQGNVSVSASFLKTNYNLVVTQAEGGTISVSKQSATYGEEITLSTSVKNGYTFVAYVVKQGNTAISVSNGKFTMPAGNVSITAVYTKNSYKITVNQATGGNVTANKSSASVGEEVTLTNTANAGYTFAKYVVKQDSTSIAVTNGKFTMPAGDVTITAEFSKQTYVVTIKVNTAGYGTVSKSSVSVAYGTSISASGSTLTIGNNTITATATSQTAQYSYAFKDWTGASGTVTGATTITANFTRSTRSYAVTIKVNTAGYGTVSKSSVTVAYGTSISASGSTLTIGSNTVTATATSQTAQYSYAFKDWTGASGTVTGATTITANFTRSTRSYTVTLTQPTGGSIKVNNSTTASRSVAYGTSITLGNSASAGYLFSSYKVNGNAETATSYTVVGATTITGTFTKGIGGLSTFNYYDVVNYNSSKTGSITTGTGSVSSSQTYYPSATTWVKGDFYYETEIALNSSKIYNSELYCKAGIVIQSASNVYYAFIDALAKGWNNGGFGNNTWLGYAPGRGDLDSGVDWSFWGSADHCGNFNKNYSSSTTYIKLGVLRVGGVYKFFANDKFMYSVWAPDAQSSVKVGLLAFNIGFEAKNSKIGAGSTVVNNVNAYYGLSNSKNPTSRTIDGKVDGRAVNDSGATIDISWKENLVNSYGVGDYTRYTYSSAFKGTDGVYVATRARTKNYITTASNIWENTNLEIRGKGGSNSQIRIFFAANGTCGIANNDGVITSTTGFKQAWTKYQEVDGYYVITLEGLIPYSAFGSGVTSSSAITLNFAFRSEEVGLNMQDGSDGVWWCGFGWTTHTITSTGLSMTRETTPTDKNIKPGVGGADPFVMPYNNKYYLYATTGTGTGFRVYVSDNLNEWRTPTTQDFTDVGVSSPKTEMKSGWVLHKNWSKPVYYSKSGTTLTCKNLWAPEVAYNPTTKKFVMTYSGYNSEELAVVSVATSDSPLGPFIDVYSGEKGFLAPTGDSAKASIDASIFVDSDGTPYLYYCNDCTRNGIENFKGDGVYWGISEIWVTQLDSTWTKTTGT